MLWYALTVKSQHEKAVVEQLRCKGVDTYLPLYRSRRRWSDRIKHIEMPLFSQYVFSQFDVQNRVKVLQTASVLSIVSFAGVPCPVDPGQLQALRAIVGSGLPFSPWPFLYAGQRVQISGGPLSGVEGILAHEKSALRVVVNMELLQRAVAVEVDRDFVRPCAQRYFPSPVIASQSNFV